MKVPGCLSASVLHAPIDDPELDRLLSPSRHYRHPKEVVADTALSTWQKRAILSSWASDSCAVESMPQLRLPRGALNPVTFDDIMDALKTLDGLPMKAPQRRCPKGPSRQTGNDCNP